MTISNEELTKGVITAADALAAAGKLNPEQADTFIDYVVDETSLTKFARMIRFRNEELDIDKIGIGRRALTPVEEAVDPGQRRGVTQSKITLNPAEFMCAPEISTTYLEHNIEGTRATDHILQMFARQIANDMEIAAIHGDTAGTLETEDVVRAGGNAALHTVDVLLAKRDGWLKQAESGAVVDLAGDPISNSVFRQMLSQMPTKFKRNRNNLVWLAPTSLEELWRERLGTRATTLGDQAIAGEGNVRPFGIELMPVALFDFYAPEVQVAQFSGVGATINLNHAPIQSGSVAIILESDAAAGLAVASYVEDTDFSVDSANGTITHIGAGSIPTTTDLRIRYNAFPQLILTTKWNLILGIGRDITMESDRDIHRRVDQYAITLKMDFKLEESTAVVLGKNISDTL